MMKRKRQTRLATMAVISRPKLCPVCGVSLKGHLDCQGCGILIGPEHITKESYPYRDCSLCASCLSRWNRLELLKGQVLDFYGFLGHEKK